MNTYTAQQVLRGEYSQDDVVIKTWTPDVWFAYQRDNNVELIDNECVYRADDYKEVRYSFVFTS